MTSNNAFERTRGSVIALRVARRSTPALASHVMDQLLLDFLRAFQTSFHPPPPYRGQSGTDWLISGVWSDYMREWLRSHYRVDFEQPLSVGRRLDAALWSNTSGPSQRHGMDIALEWEWDNNKVASVFLFGDFPKVFEVSAQCGLVIVQTRADRTRGPTQADDTVESLLRLAKTHRRDKRSVALIEIRRSLHQNDRVGFLCYFQDLDAPTKQEIGRWSYPR